MYWLNRSQTWLASHGLSAVAEELIPRWSEPVRHYHSLVHLDEMLGHIESLVVEADGPQAPGGEAELVAVLATWFHDAVLTSSRSDNEQRSANLARSVLERANSATSTKVIDDVERIVLATAHHTAPADSLDALVIDADMAILGAEPTRYDQYRADIRREYVHLSDADFRAGRATFLRTWIDADSCFITSKARQLWGERARVNMVRELAELSDHLG